MPLGWVRLGRLRRRALKVLNTFITWISYTSASKVIADAVWIIPAVQTVHILAIGVVVSTMGMLDLTGALVGQLGISVQDGLAGHGGIQAGAQASR